MAYVPIEWYRDRAEWYGIRLIARLESGVAFQDEDGTRELAMLAGHFGNLVVGLESLRGKQLMVMDYRVSAPVEMLEAFK